MGISKLIYNVYSLITFKQQKIKKIESQDTTDTTDTTITQKKCILQQPLSTLVFYEPCDFKQNIEQVYDKQSVFLVVNKSTQMPLGIYNSLELAKKNGQGSTYHNCLIYNYSINDKCTFVKNPIFEDK
jgi:hypothetical protein